MTKAPLKAATLLNIRYQFVLLAISLTFLTNVKLAAEQPFTPEIRAQCEQVLMNSLAARGEWSSVHAAEYLIRLDMTSQVLDTFRQQAENATPPFRIGVWRVLAQADPSQEARHAYVEKIRTVLLDDQATDRLHALESLAKLGIAIQSPAELKVVQRMSVPDDPGGSFALWRLYQQRPTSPIIDRLVQQLHSEDDVARLRAGFVLSQLKSLPEKARTSAAQALSEEPTDSAAYPYVASACGTAELRKLRTSQDPSHQALAIRELATRSPEIDRSLPTALNESNPLALRQAAAFAILWRDRDSTRIQ
ncbi:hypothetical protein [Blastopirellula marina]|uniref:HEAT repeat domain-containing protein n=1 Tax=Blastopirellula marina TaxID=124 RepID=A0A2S8G1J6_9BACT|nr:hypothetical protein [Blastopirellula marina]PQO38141.1 hypothetical protein C5Y98_08665 [Blastopirellula marina]PTL44797.1 hypothetical protein C5Y97_08665 [Blastopirellula marina]